MSSAPTDSGRGQGIHCHRGTRAIQKMVEFAPSTGGLALWIRHQDVDDETTRLVAANDGAANAAEFFGVLREIQAGTDVLRLLAAEPGPDTAALLPRSLDGLYGMIYALLAAATDEERMARALAIIDQLPDISSREPLPIRESQTLAMELLFQKALERSLEAAVLDSPSYRRYAEERERDEQRAD